MTVLNTHRELCTWVLNGLFAKHGSARLIDGDSFQLTQTRTSLRSRVEGPQPIDTALYYSTDSPATGAES